MNPDVLQRVLECRKLPSLPAVAARVIELTQDDNSSLKDLAATISNDQALAAKVLKTVNSSFFGLRQRCSTINQAIVILGLSAVKTLALGFSLVSAVSEVESEGFDHASYWRRALYTGIAAKCIAKEAGYGFEEEAFLGGLLQDIGMIALDQALGAEYRAVVAKAGADHRALAELELAAFEVQHADIGALLAHRWKLPEDLSLSVKYHERPTAAPAGHMNIVRAVGLGNIASDVLTSGAPSEPLSRFYARAEQWFLIRGPAADEILNEVTVAASEVGNLLRVDPGLKVNVDRILREANARLMKMTIAAPVESFEAGVPPEQEGLDDLTGAASRLRFDQMMVTMFEQAEAGAGTLSLALFEVDDFESINEDYGREAGDAVLINVARRLADVFSGDELLCRYAARRFAIAMPRTERNHAVRLADTAQKRVSGEPIKLIAGVNAPPSLPVTVSAGVASVSAEAIKRMDGFLNLTRIATQALSAARTAGSNVIRVHSSAA